MLGIAMPAPTWKTSHGRLMEGSLLMASMHSSVVGMAASATHVRPCAAQAAVQLCCRSASTHWLSNMLASRHGPLAPEPAAGAGTPPVVSSGGGDGGGKGGGGEGDGGGGVGGEAGGGGEGDGGGGGGGEYLQQQKRFW